MAQKLIFNGIAERGGLRFSRKTENMTCVLQEHIYVLQKKEYLNIKVQQYVDLV